MSKTTLTVLVASVVAAFATTYLWFESQRPSPTVLVPKAIHADIDALALKSETYRRTHGAYARSLAELTGENTVDWGTIETACRRHYSYAVSSDEKTFAIGSVGLDGVPDTADDIFFSNGSNDPRITRALLGTQHGSGTCITIRK